MDVTSKCILCEEAELKPECCFILWKNMCTSTVDTVELSAGMHKEVDYGVTSVLEMG